MEDLQVPEILVVMQVFVIDGGEASLVRNVSVRRYKCVSESTHLLTERRNKTKKHKKKYN